MKHHEYLSVKCFSFMSGTQTVETTDAKTCLPYAVVKMQTKPQYVTDNTVAQYKQKTITLLFQINLYNTHV